MYSDTDSYYFQSLLERGLDIEKNKAKDSDEAVNATLSSAQLREAQRPLDDVVFRSFIRGYKSLCFQLRGEGISFSDRRLIRFMKLFAAHAVIDGRKEVHVGTQCASAQLEQSRST